MKKLSFLIVVIAFLSAAPSFAQNVIDGGFVKEHMVARKPVPYYYLRESDVAWSKKVWRILDLKEKQNQVLYYPIIPTDDRMNLIAVLLLGIENEGIDVYEFSMENEFANQITLKEVKENMGFAMITTEEEDPVTGEIISTTAASEPDPGEITRILMKEEWFFNKNRSKMEVRIIGLCPIRRYVKETDAVGVDMEDKEMTMATLFWAYFKAYRPLFASKEVFNPNNDAERRSFDDIFFKRKFASHIYRVTNTYANRKIESYKKGEDALLEAERLKAFIFDFEQDLWEY